MASTKDVFVEQVAKRAHLNDVRSVASWLFSGKLEGDCLRFDGSDTMPVYNIILYMSDKCSGTCCGYLSPFSSVPIARTWSCGSGTGWAGEN